MYFFKSKKNRIDQLKIKQLEQLVQDLACELNSIHNVIRDDLEKLASQSNDINRNQTLLTQSIKALRDQVEDFTIIIRLLTNSLKLSKRQFETAQNIINELQNKTKTKLGKQV